MRKQNRNRNREWLKNRNATKNPKVFNMTLVRDEQGQFFAVGNQQLVLDRSGNKEKWVRVNTRDLTTMINQTGIRSL